MKPITVNGEQYIKMGDTWYHILNPVTGAKFIENLEIIRKIDQDIKPLINELENNS